LNITQSIPSSSEQSAESSNKASSNESPAQEPVESINTSSLSPSKEIKSTIRTEN